MVTPFVFPTFRRSRFLCSLSHIACDACFPATGADGQKIPSSVKTLALAPAGKTSRTRTACGAAFRHPTPRRGGMGKKREGREKSSPFLLASPTQQENDDDDDKQQPERAATNPNVVRENWQCVHIDSCANERSINLPPAISTIKGLSNPRA